ncbi:Meiosis 1 arrest protein like [Argiope bruennichi]|uniref:Meiosis 1 arrest protein like n=1 Tax=Argiope bruennichi TaxID=94029 RepID=A0A8T0FRU7_ARGBR|nr:Meiosis 1 arrest protein like [Argiope bruennichi]
MQNTTTLFTGKETFEIDHLSKSLQDVIQQYESYYQSAVPDKEEWPQLQMAFFSAQPAQKFIKCLEESLTTVELAYIQQINVVMLRGRLLTSSFNSSESKSESEQHSSQGIFDEEKENIIRSLMRVTEIEANPYQLENIFKSWLHDYGTDSDHLRLTVGNLCLRCDVKECLLNPDSLPTASQFVLFPNSNLPQPTARVNPTSKQICVSKVPVYTLETVCVVKRDGLCESLLFGQSFVALATRCWKIDWDELERNEQHFAAIVQYLKKHNLILLARRLSSPATTTEKSLPVGYFAFFPARNSLLIKSVASKELLMPFSEMQTKEVPEDIEQEIGECLGNVEEKEIFNPLAVSSGLYSFLSASITKMDRSRPSTNFVVPIINKENVQANKKKKCSTPPIAEVKANKLGKSPFETDFLTASVLFKKRFPNNLE